MAVDLMPSSSFDVIVVAKTTKDTKEISVPFFVCFVYFVSFVVLTRQTS